MNERNESVADAFGTREEMIDRYLALKAENERLGKRLSETLSKRLLRADPDGTVHQVECERCAELERAYPLGHPQERLAYVFGQLEEILPCDDDNRPIEAHARKVVAHYKAIDAYATRLAVLLETAVCGQCGGTGQGADARECEWCAKAFDTLNKQHPHSSFNVTKDTQ